MPPQVPEARDQNFLQEGVRQACKGEEMQEVLQAQRDEFGVQKCMQKVAPEKGLLEIMPKMELFLPEAVRIRL
jgi:hypothetical protein